MLTDEQILVGRLVQFSTHVAAILSRLATAFSADDGMTLLGAAKEMRVILQWIQEKD